MCIHIDQTACVFLGVNCFFPAIFFFGKYLDLIYAISILLWPSMACKKYSFMGNLQFVHKKENDLEYMHYSSTQCSSWDIKIWNYLWNWFHCFGLKPFEKTNSCCLSCVNRRLSRETKFSLMFLCCVEGQISLGDMDPLFPFFFHCDIWVSRSRRPS